MNLLEHYILKIYSKKDVTKQYEKSVGKKLDEKLYEVEMKVDCYGSVETVKRIMGENEFAEAERKGYYMA